MNHHDKAEQFHNETVASVARRLFEKYKHRTFFLSLHEPYEAITPEGQYICGEMDIHMAMKDKNGRWQHRYYEVKGTDKGECKAMCQLARHKLAHPDYKHIFVSGDGSAKRYTR
jgi:hypothetical protein